MLDLSQNGKVIFQQKDLGSFQLVRANNEPGLNRFDANAVMEIETSQDPLPMIGHSEPMVVAKVSPRIAVPGDVIKIQGTNFRNMSAYLNGKASEGLMILSDTQATFPIPANALPGKTTLYLTQEGVMASEWLVIRKDKASTVVLGMKVEDICSTDLFVSVKEQKANLESGKRACTEARECVDEKDVDCKWKGVWKSSHPVGGCHSDGQVGCLTTKDFKAALTKEILPENLAIGIKIAGVEGTLTPSPAACSSDGSMACVANSLFKAVDAAKLLPQNLISGVTTAGVAGAVTAAPVNCSMDGGVGCVTTSSYKAADMSMVLSANTQSGKSIVGIAGSAIPAPKSCSADGEIDCVASQAFKAANMQNVIGANIVQGVSVGGIPGSAVISPEQCSADGAVGCVTTNWLERALLASPEASCPVPHPV